MHLVEGSNTDEFFVAAQWKQYKCWLLYGEFVNDFLHKQYKMKRIFYVDEVRDLIHQ